MTVLDDICAYADRKLQGSNLTFALVVWCKGDEANPASVALSAPPAAQAAAPTALRTTANAVEARRGGVSLVDQVDPLARILHLEAAIRHARFQLNDGQSSCVFYNLGQALKENPLPAAVEVSVDAERFRALMRCGRIKMQGSSGVDPHTLERNGNNVHFGAEFWPEPYDPAQWEATYGESTRWGRACLRALADAIMEDEEARRQAAARGLVAEA